MKDLITFGLKLKKRIIGHELSARSAQMTYYWVLAFFPFLIMLIAILAYTPIAENEFIVYLDGFLPPAIMPFIKNTLAQVLEYRSATLLSAGAVVSLWSASAAVSILIKGIHKAYSAIDSRPFWYRKALSVFYTAILALLIVGMIILLIFGNRLGSYVIDTFFKGNLVLKLIWEISRLALPLVALLLGLFIIYRFIPRRHLASKNVWPGTILTTIGWYGFSILFSIYVDKVSRYNQMYGSLGGMFILLIWLYSSGLLLLLGAEVNALCQDIKKMKRRI